MSTLNHLLSTLCDFYVKRSQLLAVWWNKVCLPLSAVRCVDLTVDAAESYRAAAGVAVDTVGAVPSITAGGTHTLVYVLCTALPTETSQTHTHKAVHTVLTHTAVTARI